MIYIQLQNLRKHPRQASQRDASYAVWFRSRISCLVAGFFLLTHTATSCAQPSAQPTFQPFISRNMTDSNWRIVSDGNNEAQGQSWPGSQTSGEWATLKYQPASGSEPAFTRFRLFTYNPDPDRRGQFMLMPQIKSFPGFLGPRGGNVKFEARMRFGPSRRGGGIVCGFYPYGQDGWNGKVYGQNEIDMEFLHNQMPSGKIWTNIYQDYDDRQRFDHPVNTNKRLDYFYNWLDPNYLKSAGITNWFEFRTYKITWSSNAIAWHVNNSPLSQKRRGPDFDGPVPIANYNKSLQVFMNMWAPDPNGPTGAWQQAVATNDFRPASSPSTSESWYYDVEFVRVTGAKKVEGRAKTGARGRS